MTMPTALEPTRIRPGGDTVTLVEGATFACPTGTATS
jgi:hypothetical protein